MKKRTNKTLKKIKNKTMKKRTNKTMREKTKFSVYDIIEEMKRTKTYFHLISTLPYAVTICVAIPGQRIEIDVYEDENIDIAQFTGEEVSDLTLSEFYKLISEEIEMPI